ncbi:MAG: SusD/RagB family nutrient-binding outer membrane lipoprotein [Gelidibacter sp.]
MKNIKYTLLAVLAFIAVSCDKDFETVNTDPNNPTVIPAHLLLGNIIRTNQNVIYNAQAGGDMGECWGQHWSKVQYNSEARYIPRRGVIDGIWNSLYASVISDAKSMYDLAESEGNDNLKGASLVLRANAYQILVDLYGPVPFSQAITPGINQPAYDSGEDVYAGIIDMLDQAVSLFSPNGGDIPASSDLLYGGDSSKWKKLANSLKFKVLMRSHNTAGLQALVSGGNLFSSNDDSAQLIYTANNPDANPIYETIVFGSRLEYKVSEPLVDLLKNLNDPRLAVYASKNASGEYLGKPAGYIDLPNDALGYTYANISGLGDKYLDPTLPGVVMSYAQLQFLLAEAANEGYIGGGVVAALGYYEEGIRASFQFNGLDATAYLAQPNLTFSTQADARQKIATQEWLALYGQGFETWIEWRRTGFPVLTPAIEGDIDQIPSRLYYPTTENSLNGANYQEAVSTLNNGDELTSKVFWDN